MPRTAFLIILFLAVLLPPTHGQAATCLTGGCHSALAARKHLHGPIAAEQIGGQGCVACHVPDGPACSRFAGGRFKPLPAAAEMCRFCHTQGSSTAHTDENSDCLNCHDPHGADSGPEFLRPDRSP